jgi:hypothetical protein
MTMGGRSCTWICGMFFLSCAGAAAKAPPRPSVTPFAGVETAEWLVQETEPVQRNDILSAFEWSAQEYGCQTEELGSSSTHRTYAHVRTYYGVSASCQEGTIALMTLVGGRVRIGCTKPTTPEACEALLRNISQGSGTLSGH